MGAFSLRIIIYIIDLLTRVHLRFATELPYLCSASEKALFFRVLCGCLRVVLFGCAATNRLI